MVCAGRNVLEIKAGVCCCNCRFGVRLLEERSDEYLAAHVKQRFEAQPHESTAAGRARVAASFAMSLQAAAADADALQETCVHASLRDPLTLRRLATPVRGQRCRHAQPFDLLSFIAFQRTDIRFRCPVKLIFSLRSRID